MKYHVDKINPNTKSYNIPETQRDKYTDFATLGFIGGFIVMMTLDVGLG